MAWIPSAMFHGYGSLDFRCSCLNRGWDKMQEQDKRNILLKPFRSGESVCVGLKQVPYFKYFLVFANGLWVGSESFVVVVVVVVLQVHYFLLQDERRKKCWKKESKKIILISEHVGVNSFGISCFISRLIRHAICQVMVSLLGYHGI